MQTQLIKKRKKTAALELSHLPAVNFFHLSNLTDETGILQQGDSGAEGRKDSYCLDDNACALLLAVWAAKDKKNPTAMRLLPIYINLVHTLQTDQGDFKNSMNTEKVCGDERCGEDSFGRAIMAIGFLVNEGPSNSFIKTGVEMFLKAYRNIEKIASIRGIAYSMIGVCQFIKYNFPDDIKRELVIVLANKMVGMYQEHKRADWSWFEPVMTGETAVLPLALLNAYEITSEEIYLSIALDSLEFLESNLMFNGILSPVGNQGWLAYGQTAANYEQSAIATTAMILCYQQAYRVTSDDKFLRHMYQCYQWFLGSNDTGISLYDPATGSCARGINGGGVNTDQPAESTLAYWLSHLVVAAALKG